MAEMKLMVFAAKVVKGLNGLVEFYTDDHSILVISLQTSH